MYTYPYALRGSKNRNPSAGVAVCIQETMQAKPIYPHMHLGINLTSGHMILGTTDFASAMSCFARGSDPKTGSDKFPLVCFLSINDKKSILRAYVTESVPILTYITV